MNYYQARQRLSDKTWHFTCMNDGQIWAVGDCRNHAGHATKEEAEECYRKYLLNNKLHLDRKREDTKQKCVVCGEWTQSYAEVDMEQWPLCDSHRTKEHVDKLLKPKTEIISSY